MNILFYVILFIFFFVYGMDTKKRGIDYEEMSIVLYNITSYDDFLEYGRNSF